MHYRSKHSNTSANCSISVHLLRLWCTLQVQWPGQQFTESLHRQRKTLDKSLILYSWIWLQDVYWSCSTRCFWREGYSPLAVCLPDERRLWQQPTMALQRNSAPPTDQPTWSQWRSLPRETNSVWQHYSQCMLCKVIMLLIILQVPYYKVCIQCISLAIATTYNKFPANVNVTVCIHYTV